MDVLDLGGASFDPLADQVVVTHVCHCISVICPLVICYIAMV